MEKQRDISLDEETYKEILDQSLTAIFIITSERIRWVNRTMTEILGHSRDDLIGRDPFELIHSDERAQVRRIALERIDGRREGEVYETRMIRKDGSILWAEIRATPTRFQGEPAALTNLIDITDRRQAEQALTESEQRFRAFFENAPIGIYRTKPSGEVLLANPALLSMLGYGDAGSLQSRDLNREGFEPTYPRSEFRDRIERDGEVRGLESAWIRLDDSLLYVRENAQVVRDKEGQVLFYEGTVEDITRQKQANQALALFAQRLQVKQEVDQAILAAHSPEEVVRAVTSRVRRLVPCQRATVILIDQDQGTARVAVTSGPNDWKQVIEEGTSMPIVDLVSPEMLSEHKPRYVPDLAATDSSRKSIARLKAGGLRSVLTIPVAAEGNLIGTFSLAHTDPHAFDADQQQIAAALGDQLAIALHQARLRKELSLERERLQALIENLPEGVLLLDGDRRVLVANPRAVRYLEALSATGVGQVLSHLGDYDLSVLLPDNVLGTDFELGLEGPPQRFFEVSCRPVHPKSSNPGSAIVLREVTEDRRVRQQLQAQERQATVGALAAGLAHDFNNLISAIEGCAWILLRRLGDDSQLRSPAQEIRDTCTRAARVTKQLLQFSRSRARHTRRVNLNGVVSEMGQMLDRLLGGSVELRTDLANDLGSIQADPTQLEQIVVNLAVNARDAMPMGGNLAITTANLKLNEPEDAWPDHCEPGEYVCLRIEDTGSGMDEETAERIFEPFFTTREAEGGTGLGLATVRGIVAQASGRIRMRTAPEEGTTFEILFPTDR